MSQLAPYEESVHSQHGEDGIIREVFRRLGVESGYFVEFGAMDGIALSNTYRLVEQDGWRGCYIEAMHERFVELQSNMAGREIACVECFVEPEGSNSLDNILERAGAPRDFELLSIDIDSDDHAVWEHFTEHSAQMVIVEFNQSIPNSYHFVQERGDNVGNSARALAELGRSKGYDLIGATATNLLFLRGDIREKTGFDAVDLHQCRPELGAIFYAFDGRVVADRRMRSSPWSGRPLYQEINDIRPTFRDIRRLVRKWLRRKDRHLVDRPPSNGNASSGSA